MNFSRRTFVLGSAVGMAIPASAKVRIFRPEEFGARGDGHTNDTEAFGKLSRYLNQIGEGTVIFGRGKTYVVGMQVRHAGRYLLTPLPILKFQRLAGPLQLLGNGAKLIAEPGLRFGVFNEHDLRPKATRKGHYDPKGIASPYDAMIDIESCLGSIEIRDLELDGGLPRLQIGGGWGDTGHQLPGSGLILRNNRGSEKISNLYSHHHPLDGLLLDGETGRLERSRFSRVRCAYNGRQGVSLVGGRGYDFLNCDFSHTGRSAVQSAPGAGVDIEAEGKTVRDVTFSRCRFADNTGPGLLADSGNTELVVCTDSQFIGVSSWSAWPRKPRMRFERCLFIGALSNAFASERDQLATKFINCTFTDDPGNSQWLQVYLAGGSIVDLGGNLGTNVLFESCLFNLVGKGRLPWTVKAIFSNSVMRQVSSVTAYPRGRFIGTNIITGPVDLYSSTISGRLMVNGQQVKHL